ncbi:MAG: hypothetical protein KF898_07045 [Parachlamydiales bacterium]|nr:hypothetical protein [Candidatus Acheromyda pituitae]
MKKFDFFLTLLVCSSALSLNAETPDKKICSKEYFPGEEAVTPSLADDVNPAPAPNTPNQSSPSQIPITPPEPSTDKQYVPTPTSPAK